MHVTSSLPNLRPARRTLVAALVAAPLGVALWASPASAHTPTVSADCTHGLVATFTDYEPGTHVVAESDGKVIAEYRFDSDWTLNAVLLPTYLPHQWKVSVDNGGDGMTGDPFDEVFTGTVPACTAAPTTTAPRPPVSYAPATTGLPLPVPAVEIGTAAVLEQPAATELARTGLSMRNTVWTLVAALGCAALGTAFVIVEKVMK